MTYSNLPTVHIHTTRHTRGDLEKIADRCDRRAESRNNHEVVGMHRLLAALLYEELGYAVATEIMRHISRLGGLDGMNGLDWHRTAHKVLHVPEGTDAWAVDPAREGPPAPPVAVQTLNFGQVLEAALASRARHFGPIIVE